jgi:hypothetical protein
VSYTAPGTAQAVVLTFQNSDGGTDTIGLTISGPPTVTSIAPSTGVPVSSSKTVTINGNGFVSAGSTLSASAGTMSGITVTSTAITFTYNAPAAAQNVTFQFTNADGGTVTTGPLAVRALPTITNFTPVSAARGSNTTFTVTGTGFFTSGGVTPTVRLTSASTGVWYNAASTFVNATTLTVTFSPVNGMQGNNQTLSVRVTNPDTGQVTKTFTVTIT